MPFCWNGSEMGVEQWPEEDSIPGVYFTNILRASFLKTEVFYTALMCLQFGRVIFWQKDISKNRCRLKSTLAVPGKKCMCFLAVLAIWT